MIIDKNGATFVYKEITNTIGAKVYATETEKVSVRQYRVMVGADGADYVYADDLPWEEAVSIRGRLTLAPGAYAYIQEVSENG